MWREIRDGLLPPIAYAFLGRAARARRLRHAATARLARSAHNAGLALYSAWVAVDVAGRLAHEGRLSDPHALVCQTPSVDGG